jgi:hypothetical protein
MKNGSPWTIFSIVRSLASYGMLFSVVLGDA